jgi:hypothetical protein
MNRVKTFSLTLLVLLASVWLSPLQAQTLLKRVYISVSGTDGSSCGTLSSPCRYLSYAMTYRVTAGGEVVIMNSGTYDTGGVTISQAVTVSAPTGVSAGFKNSASGAAITVSAGTSDAVVLRGLTIYDGDSGISFMTGGSLHVENCIITGAYSYGIYAEASGKLFVKDSEVRNATDYSNSSGIIIYPLSGTLTAYIDRTRVENCTNTGIYVADGAKAFVRQSVVTGNGSGFLSEPSSTAAELTIDQCQVINNTKGIEAKGTVASGSDIHVVNTTIARNATGLSISTGGSYQGRILSRTDSSGNETNTWEANTTNVGVSGTTFTTFNAQ